jgi:hypothetical protein
VGLCLDVLRRVRGKGGVDKVKEDGPKAGKHAGGGVADVFDGSVLGDQIVDVSTQNADGSGEYVDHLVVGILTCMNHGSVQSRVYFQIVRHAKSFVRSINVRIALGALVVASHAIHMCEDYQGHSLC